MVNKNSSSNKQLIVYKFGAYGQRLRGNNYTIVKRISII